MNCSPLWTSFSAETTGFIACSSSAVRRRAVEDRCKMLRILSVSTIPACALKSLLLKTGGSLRTENCGLVSHNIGIIELYKFEKRQHGVASFRFFATYESVFFLSGYFLDLSSSAFRLAGSSILNSTSFCCDLTINKPCSQAKSYVNSLYSEQV